MPLGITPTIIKHYRKQARGVWNLQRMPDNYPVVDIVTIVPNNTPTPYLENTPTYVIQHNIPVVYEPMRDTNVFGVVLSDASIYFVFLGDVSKSDNVQNFERGMAATFSKDAMIILFGMVFRIVSMSHDMGTDLSKITAALVKGESADRFIGVIT